MLSRISRFYLFSNFNKNVDLKTSGQGPVKDQPRQVSRTNYGSLKFLTDQRKRLAIEYRKKLNSQLPVAEFKAYIEQNLCDIVLYIKYDDWRSQYTYAIMNYQQIGFKKISDEIYLKQITKAVGVHKNSDHEKWPIMKFKLPLTETKYIVGLKNICNFIQEKALFQHQVSDDEHLTPIIEDFVQKQVVPHMESIFWHPRLTFQQTFHTDMNAYSRGTQNYKLIPIFYSNLYKVAKNVIKNLYKITTNYDKYLKSKENLSKGLKQITTMLNSKEFFGGNKPGHIDFYVLSILSTRNSNQNFQQYLRNEIGGGLWDWYCRMKRLTKYDSQRITLM